MGVTLDLWTRGAVQPNTPSCGNQPAHIRVTTRRKTRGHRPPVRPEPRRRPRTHRGRRLTLPLDKPALHIRACLLCAEPGDDGREDGAGAVDDGELVVSGGPVSYTHLRAH